MASNLKPSKRRATAREPQQYTHVSVGLRRPPPPHTHNRRWSHTTHHGAGCTDSQRRHASSQPDSECADPEPPHVLGSSQASAVAASLHNRTHEKREARVRARTRPNRPQPTHPSAEQLCTAEPTAKDGCSARPTRWVPRECCGLSGKRARVGTRSKWRAVRGAVLVHVRRGVNQSSKHPRGDSAARATHPITVPAVELEMRKLSTASASTNTAARPWA